MIFLILDGSRDKEHKVTAPRVIMTVLTRPFELGAAGACYYITLPTDLFNFIGLHRLGLELMHW